MLSELLGSGISGRSLEVRSATGCTRRFPLGDADKMMLAHDWAEGHCRGATVLPLAWWRPDGGGWGG